MPSTPSIGGGPSPTQAGVHKSSGALPSKNCWGRHLGGEHKLTGEAMSESEKFHRLAVEAGRIGTWDLDLQTDECLISPTMAELMDFSPEQTTVPGAQWRKSIVPDDRTLMSSALTPSIASDTPFDLEFRIALKDGTQRWLYSRGAVSRDASGKALRMYGATIDVTDRKRAEEEQDRLRAREIEARTEKGGGGGGARGRA